MQSISNKVDWIGSELRNFNVICLVETCLCQNTTDEALRIDEYKLFRRDRLTDNTMDVYVSTLTKISILVVEPI